MDDYAPPPRWATSPLNQTSHRSTRSSCRSTRSTRPVPANQITHKTTNQVNKIQNGSNNSQSDEPCVNQSYPPKMPRTFGEQATGDGAAMSKKEDQKMDLSRLYKEFADNMKIENPTGYEWLGISTGLKHAPFKANAKAVELMENIAVLEDDPSPTATARKLVVALMHHSQNPLELSSLKSVKKDVFVALTNWGDAPYFKDENEGEESGNASDETADESQDNEATEIEAEQQPESFTGEQQKHFQQKRTFHNQYR